MHGVVGGRCSGWASTALGDCLCGTFRGKGPVAAARQRFVKRSHDITYGFATRVASRRQPRPVSAVLNGTALESGGNGIGPTVDGGMPGITDTELRAEAEQSYLAYAMSVIVGRALPDVRDGLKPVHRRILFAMHELGMISTKPYRKCARVVGEVLGKYHPHGDTAVYDALVRLAQDFSMRSPLVAGHGNFGSLDADPPAAMRYTECRLQSSTMAIMLADIGFDTVNFSPNFDGSTEEPVVLPARVPNLLVNGSSGIAVGIATKIPPHNLREVVAGLCALIRNPDITITELMQYIPAPDFPTGGEILASEGIAQAYETGRGPITVRGRVMIEEEGASRSPTRRGGRKDAGPRRVAGSGRPLIVITELPYQTNKSKWVEQVVSLVDAGTLTGVSDVRDESDRDGVRLVVEVKKGANAEVVLNGLYKHTELQSRFSCNMVALVGSTPLTLNLKQFLQHFLDFRCQVVERRARYDLERAERRQHIVQGLLTALGRLDAVVAAIRAAPDGAAAGVALRDNFGLSAEQADAVLGMALRRLTSLETGKLEEETRDLAARIASLSGLLASPAAVLDVVEAEAKEVAERFGDERRSRVRADVDGQLVAEDVIPNRESLLVYSRRGYIKRMQTDLFAAQGRGGRGKTGARLREDDTMEEVLHIHDHDHVLFFTPDGNVRSVRAHQIPEASRTASGTAITQVLPVSKDTTFAAMLSVSEFREDECLVLLTRNGVIKKTPIRQFQGIRANGIAAIKLNEGDELVWVNRCAARDGVLLGSCDGQLILFPTDDDQLRPMARSARGVRAMKLSPGARLVGMAILRAVRDTSPDVADDSEDDDIDAEVGDAASAPDGSNGAEVEGEAVVPDGPSVLLVTLQGLGKRVPVSQFRLQRRGGRGLRSLRLNSGDELAALHVVGTDGEEEGDVLLGSTAGLMTRTSLANIPTRSRAARGVGVLRLDSGDTVQSVALLPAADAQPVPAV